MNAFKRVWVDNLMRGGALIFWELNTASLKDKTPYTFELEYGRTINEWEAVDIPPIENTFFLYDPNQRLFAKQIDLYYRVKLTTSRNVYYSDPARADGNMPRRDWLFAREITRKEYLRLIKFSGVHGVLFKRREWGDRCTCNDWDTDTPAKPNCLLCYGTGVTGGYYDPVHFWMELTNQQQKLSREEQGLIGDINIQGKGVPYPMLQTGDVWTSCTTDKRFIVKAVAESAAIRDKPILLQVELALAPVSDIVYALNNSICGLGDIDGPRTPCQSIEKGGICRCE